MRIGIWLPIFLLSLAACTDGRSSRAQDIIEAYYGGLNAADFKQVRDVVADSFTLIEGEFVTPLTRDEHYVVFQWDSVFATTYTIEKIEAIEDGARALVASSSKRYAFLKNNPLTCEMTFSLSAGKIARVKVGDCAHADWEVWASRRDSLVSWVDDNHPELSGFINDLTKEGAENYLRAIELYESRSD